MGEWIKHTTGVRPVSAETMVEVRFKCGDVCGELSAQRWDWSGADHDYVIIAYRVLEGSGMPDDIMKVARMCTTDNEIANAILAERNRCAEAVRAQTPQWVLDEIGDYWEGYREAIEDALVDIVQVNA